MNTKGVNTTEDIAIKLLKKNKHSLAKPLRYLINIMFSMGPSIFRKSSIDPLSKKYNKMDDINYTLRKILDKILNIFEDVDHTFLNKLHSYEIGGIA